MSKTTTDKLKPNPRNPNRMGDDDKAMMAKSLAKFGDLSGIIFNVKSGLLVGGHQRTSIMKDCEIVITEKYKKPEKDGTVSRGYVLHNGSRHSYRGVSWTQATESSALLAANRFGRIGIDDPQFVKDILQELDTGAFDMDLTGYDMASIEDLMTQFRSGEVLDLDAKKNDGALSKCPKCGFSFEVPS